MTINLLNYQRVFGVLMILGILLVNSSKAQDLTPLNTNYLINRGISPRILDFAANSALQDGRYNENVTISVNMNGEENVYQMKTIYDPSFTDGMDMRFVVEGSSASKKETKALSEVIKNTHHFSRLVEQYLYDESTLKPIKDEDGIVVFEFYYRRIAVDPSMKFIKRLKGYIHFKDGELEYVELVNVKPMKKGIKNYSRKVYFKRIGENEGYFIERAFEKYEVHRTKSPAELEISIVTTEYGNVGGSAQYTNEVAEQEIQFSNPDTISVKLGNVLPLFGKPATKLGYKLPRPFGIQPFIHLQEQTLQFTGLSLGVNGGEMVTLNDLFVLDESSLRQTTVAYSVRGDAWIFPFMNVMLLAGRADNAVDGDLLLTDDVKTLLGILGVQDVPDALNIVTNVTTNLYGGGVTFAGGVGDFNFTLAYQLIFADAYEVNTLTTAQAVTGLVGYMLPFGMNIMAGAQGQFYEPGIGGSIDLGDGNNLDFLVDFEPRRWNFFGGIYKGFAKHWDVTMQVGIGARSSVTMMLGYRF